MSTLDLSKKDSVTRCSAHIETNLVCSVPYYSSYKWNSMYLESCLVRTWSGGGQSVAETCTGQARHVSATSQPRVTVDIAYINRM